MAKRRKEQIGQAERPKRSPPRKAAKKAAAAAVESDSGDDKEIGRAAPAPTRGLIAHYKEKVVPAIQQKFGYTNLFRGVPRLEKIVISMGLGKFATEGGDGKAKFQQAEKELASIAGPEAGSPVQGQERSVANFKVREGMETGPEGHAPRGRPHVRVPRSPDLAGDPPREGLPRPFAQGFRQDRQLQLRVQRTDRCSRKSTAAAVTFQQGMNITIVQLEPLRRPSRAGSCWSDSGSRSRLKTTRASKQ